MSRRDIDAAWAGIVDGSRGNMAAAFYAAAEFDDPGLRSVLSSRAVRAAGRCPVVPDDAPAAGSFVWVDGSRRARLAGGRGA